MSTKNVKVGAGKAVHASHTMFGLTAALCGAGFPHEGQIRFRRSAVSFTDQAVTCQRCQSILAERAAVLAEREAAASN